MVFDRLDDACRADAVFGGQFLMDRVAAENAEPEEGDDSRDEHHSEDEFADRPAPADAGDKDPDERSPRDPPTPIENGPGSLPGSFAGFGEDLKSHGDEVLQVSGNRRAEQFQQPLKISPEQKVGEQQ